MNRGNILRPIGVTVAAGLIGGQWWDWTGIDRLLPDLPNMPLLSLLVTLALLLLTTIPVLFLIAFNVKEWRDWYRQFSISPNGKGVAHE